MQAHDVGERDGDAAGLRSLAQVDDTIGDQDDATHAWLSFPTGARNVRIAPLTGSNGRAGKWFLAVQQNASARSGGR